MQRAPVLRRLAVAVGIGVMAAGLVRLRGHGRLTPQHGGWSELTEERLGEMTERSRGGVSPATTSSGDDSQRI